MDVTVSLGGSVFTENLENIEMFAEQLRNMADSCDKLVVVVGAGNLKNHISAASEYSNCSEKDMIGIRATRLNAAVLNSYLKQSFPGVPESMQELREALSIGDIVVMGGTEPGHSTDAVAALAAEIVDADLMVNVTDVDGVYRDPDRPETKIDSMDYSELRKVLRSTSSEPGKYALMDRTSIDILERSGINTVVVDGDKEGSIISVLDKEGEGTRIKL